MYLIKVLSSIESKFYNCLLQTRDKTKSLTYSTTFFTTFTGSVICHHTSHLCRLIINISGACSPWQKENKKTPSATLKCCLWKQKNMIANQTCFPLISRKKAMTNFPRREVSAAAAPTESRLPDSPGSEIETNCAKRKMDKRSHVFIKPVDHETIGNRESSRQLPSFVQWHLQLPTVPLFINISVYLCVNINWSHSLEWLYSHTHTAITTLFYIIWKWRNVVSGGRCSASLMTFTLRHRCVWSTSGTSKKKNPLQSALFSCPAW